MTRNLFSPLGILYPCVSLFDASDNGNSSKIGVGTEGRDDKIS